MRVKRDDVETRELFLVTNVVARALAATGRNEFSLSILSRLAIIICILEIQAMFAHNRF